MQVDCATVSSLATAAGTPVLAVATFAAVRSANQMTVDLLYGDHEGGQRIITRFGLVPRGDDGWLLTAGRYWNVDRPDPRIRPN